MRSTAGGLSGGSVTNVVDIYDDSLGKWTVAQLSQARHLLEATTVGNVALFAGGITGALLFV
jgi:hypothetical protein